MTNMKKIFFTKNKNRNPKNGQAVLMVVTFLTFISLAVLYGIISPTVKNVSLSRGAMNSAKSYYLAESGSEDVYYRLKSGKQVSTTETLSLDGGTATTVVTDVSGSEKEIVSSGDLLSGLRKLKTGITISNGASFNYGVQVGQGGFVMENNSSVLGNIYSNGTVSGFGSNLVKGDVISAGPSGSVSGIHATSSVYAHTILNSTIDKDAYYQVISGSTISGTSYPGSADQPLIDLPISDETINGWETDAESGGVINSPCPYKINSDVTIGPKKINCDLEISGTPTVTLTGNVWVSGKIDIKNSPIIRVSPDLFGKTIAFIADNPSNRTSSSKIEIENSVSVQGSGTGSYVLFISQNQSAEQGGGERAIEVENSANGAILVYAGHGEVLLKNNINLREVTAYRVRLQNSAQVSYETGAASLLFTGGPSGGWNLKNWFETY